MLSSQLTLSPSQTENANIEGLLRVPSKPKKGHSKGSSSSRAHPMFSRLQCLAPIAESAFAVRRLRGWRASQVFGEYSTLNGSTLYAALTPKQTETETAQERSDYDLRLMTRLAVS